MASGFFLGGMADGIQQERASQQKSRALDLQSRGLDIQEQQIKANTDISTTKARRERVKELNSRVNTMIQGLVDAKENNSKFTGENAEAAFKSIDAVSATIRKLNQMDGFDSPDAVAEARRRLATALTPQQRAEQEASAAGSKSAATAQATIDTNAKPENIATNTEIARQREIGERSARVAAFEQLNGPGSFQRLSQVDQMRVQGFGGGQTINVGEGATPFQKKSGELAAGRQNEFAQMGQAAQQTIASSRLMGDLLVRDDVVTGGLVPGITGVQAVADSLGVDLRAVFEKTLGRDIGELSSKQEFDRLTKAVALDSLQKFKGGTSEKELQFARDTVAQLGTTKEANIRAIAAQQALAEIASENSDRVSSAETRADFLAEERRINRRGADDIVNRTREIETELLARLGDVEKAEKIEVPDFTKFTDDQIDNFDLTNMPDPVLDAFIAEKTRRLAAPR